MGDAAREGGGEEGREREREEGKEGGGGRGERERGREGGWKRRRVERRKTECRYEGQKIGKEGNERYREVRVHIIIHHVSSKRWYGHYKLQSGFWSHARHPHIILFFLPIILFSNSQNDPLLFL